MERNPGFPGDGRHAAMRVVRLAETVSTMADARALARAGNAEGLIVMADAQTGGRGRLPGRTWEAAPGSSLLATVILGPSALDVPALPLRAGLALCSVVEAIARANGRDASMFRLKWPNDLLAGMPPDGEAGDEPQAGGAHADEAHAGGATGDEAHAGGAHACGAHDCGAHDCGTPAVEAAPGRYRKLAGILCEVAGDHVLVGVGLNLRRGSYPEKLGSLAACLAEALAIPDGALPGRELIAREFAAGLAALAADPGWRADYTERLWAMGGMVTFVEGHPDSGLVREGILEGVDEEGSVLVRTPGNGVSAFASGEITGMRRTGGESFRPGRQPR